MSVAQFNATMDTKIWKWGTPGEETRQKPTGRPENCQVPPSCQFYELLQSPQGKKTKKIQKFS